MYGWNGESYCLVKMIVTNEENSSLPTIVGLDIIQYIDETWEDDNIFYDVTNQMMTQFEVHYVGIKILSEQTTSAQIFNWYSGYENSDTDYYNWMTAATFSTDTLITDPDGGVGILAGEPASLQPANSRTIFFAIAVGSNETDMINNMNAANQQYLAITAVEKDLNSFPDEYSLQQNYPNPFNPATKINFSIPETEFVNLTVYNLLGEVVAELVNSELAPGNYSYEFDASKLTSGIYFYEIKAGQFSETKKMMLMK